MVIQGRSFMGRVNDLKPKEVVSLLLDDEEIERKYREQSSIQVGFLSFFIVRNFSQSFHVFNEG